MNRKSSRRRFGLPALTSLRHTLLASALLLAFPAWSFTSGSTAADGPFSPTINTVVQLPPSGVLNYTSVNIPVGVTVTFLKNVTNTPAVILATNDVIVAGIININGKNSVDVGASGTGNLGDDGLPGEGGIGGYSGGAGGKSTPATSVDRDGGNGQGPGAGARGIGATITGGTGAGYGTVGARDPFTLTGGGGVYGSSALLPLIGGSGGGGGAGGSSFAGSGGGGGAGAILIAASGTITISGSILATGGLAGAGSGTGCGTPGGAGSGGAIRLVATTITGNGTLNAAGATHQSASCENDTRYGGAAGNGRIRLESEIFTRSAASNPLHTFSAPGQIFVAGVPTLTITSVAGTSAPAVPTGNADITLPANTINPVTVAFQTTGVPVGNNVKLTVTPAYGAPVTAVSPAITGTTTLGTASVPVTLPVGPSTLLAQTTYTITIAMGQALSMFAQNEQVERVAIKSVPGKPNQYFLVTVSGKEFEVPLARLVGII